LLLSQRELELLELIAVGRTNREIAGELFIAVGTVNGQTVNILPKLDGANRTEAVVKARQIGLVQ
jgi:DNA-binding NarL/FixJ family response regulator